MKGNAGKKFKNLLLKKWNVWLENMISYQKKNIWVAIKDGLANPIMK